MAREKRKVLTEKNPFKRAAETEGSAPKYVKKKRGSNETASPGL